METKPVKVPEPYIQSLSNKIKIESTS